VIEQIARKLVGASVFALAALMPALGVEAAALSCTQAAEAAEAGVGLPTGLLLAIGNIESGRLNGAGMRVPWPWTIQAAGTGRFFGTIEEAVAALQTLHAAGVQSIDIGCFQVNLLHHPSVFSDLDSGFDPLINAFAAARFLAALHGEFGAWPPAIAAYHSRSDLLGAHYQDEVLASWHGGPPAVETVIAGMHIWGPGGELGAGSSTSPYFQAVVGHSSLLLRTSSRLPRVVTVSVR
jgi:hypothetical protein